MSKQRARAKAQNCAESVRDMRQLDEQLSSSATLWSRIPVDRGIPYTRRRTMAKPTLRALRILLALFLSACGMGSNGADAGDAGDIVR